MIVNILNNKKNLNHQNNYYNILLIKERNLLNKYYLIIIKWMIQFIKH